MRAATVGLTLPNATRYIEEIAAPFRKPGKTFLKSPPPELLRFYHPNLVSHTSEHLFS
jgi:hypothetical protein